jgi:cell division protein FtsZ
MGGGTGTGAAPVVAEISKQTGALTIAVVTKPFTFEGVHRTEVAEDGIVQLLGKSDTLVIIPNDKLLDLFDQKTCVDNAFELVDDLLKECIWAVAETITGPGLITLSIADVKALLENSGPAWMSIGTGEGKNRAVDAAKAAINSPLMDVSIDNSKSVLLHISGGANLTLYEVNEAADVLKQVINPEANIIFGVAQNPDLANKLKITLIATNFASKLGLADIKREEEYTQLLRGLKTDEFSLEAFLRRCRAQNN